MTHPLQHDFRRAREIRLGVVMYGGVSLAIYINGAAQELLRFVQGAGPYAVLKWLTQSDAVVDVISGTSAGGINGVYLGYALSHEKDLTPLTKLWIWRGSFMELLQPPFKRDVESLLKGEEYFMRELQKSLEALGDHHPKPTDLPTPVREVDLFVTATRFEGAWARVLDDRGSPIDVKDHRFTFHLQYRRESPHLPPRKDDFHPAGRPEPEDYERLARICRTTSAFPFAFEPSCVDPEMFKALHQSEDPLKRLDARAWFIDGGVLDNKPFTSTLREIFLRSADREVDRKLIYIEPDPEMAGAAKETAKDAESTKPNFLQTSLAALDIPRYESIADDLRLLQSHNARLSRLGAFADMVARDLRTGTISIPDRERLTYYRLRVRSLREFLQVAWGPAFHRFALQEEGAERQRRLRLPRGLAAALDRVLERSCEETGQSRTFRFALAEVDYEWHLRQLFFLIYEIYGWITDPPTPDAPHLVERDREVIQQVMDALFRAHLPVIELLQSALAAGATLAVEPSSLLDRLFAGEAAHAEDEGIGRATEILWARTFVIFNSLLTLQGTEEREVRVEGLRAFRETLGSAELPLSTEHIRALRGALRGMLQALPQALERIETTRAAEALQWDRTQNVLTRLDRRAVDLIDRQADRLTNVEAGTVLRGLPALFADLDVRAFPAQFVASIYERDEIELVRISPADAQILLSRRTPWQDKVAGDSLGHFGGFLKSTWRANDILWGRLDAATILLDTFLDVKRVRSLHPNPGRVRELLKQYLVRPLIEGMQSPDPATTHYERALDDAWPPGAVDWRNLDAQALTAVRDLIMHRAQIEILQEELPRVIATSVAESLEWSDERPQPSRRAVERSVRELEGVVEKARTATRDLYEASSDPLVRTVWNQALWEYLRARVKDPRLLEADFMSGFRVGAESPLTLPPWILAEVTSHSLLVTVNLFRRISGGLPMAGRLLRALTGILAVPYLVSRIFRMSSKRAWGWHAFILGGSLLLLLSFAGTTRYLNVTIPFLIWLAPVAVALGWLALFAAQEPGAFRGLWELGVLAATVVALIAAWRNQNLLKGFLVKTLVPLPLWVVGVWVVLTLALGAWIARARRRG